MKYIILISIIANVMLTSMLIYYNEYIVCIGDSYCFVPNKWEYWLNRYQTLITGILAVLAAFLSINAVRDQINDVKLAREQNQYESCKVFLALAISYYNKNMRFIQNVVKINNDYKTGRIQIPKEIEHNITKATIRDFLNSSENFKNLPNGTTSFFILLREDWLGMEDIIDTIKVLKDYPSNEEFPNDFFNKNVDNLNDLAEQLKSKVELFIKENPKANPNI